MREDKPVASQTGRLELTRRRQELVGLGGDPHRLGWPSQPAECLGQAEENLPALRGRRIRVENGPEGVLRRGPVARRQPELGLHPGPAAVGIGEKVARRRPEPDGEESQGGHRRLDQAVLEGADVGLRVAPFRHLALGQSGAKPRGPKTNPDQFRKVSVFGGEAAALNGPHGRQDTPRSTSD